MATTVDKALQSSLNYLASISWVDDSIVDVTQLEKVAKQGNISFRTTPKSNTLITSSDVTRSVKRYLAGKSDIYDVVCALVNDSIERCKDLKSEQKIQNVSQELSKVYNTLRRYLEESAN